MSSRNINVALIQILTGNEAFCEESGERTRASVNAEVARILRDLADKLEAAPYRDASGFRSLYDVNGNKVGDYQLAEVGHVRVERIA